MYVYTGGMGGKRVTIVDIARELGISKSLVSNALHDRGRVAESTRQRVRFMAAELGYVSNRAAQQLRGSRYGTVGLMIPSELRALSFYMQVTMGISEASAESGCDLMFYTQANEESHVRLDVPIDGAIVCDPVPSDPRIEQLARAHIPVVTIGHADQTQMPLIQGTVSIDFRAAMSKIFADLDSSGGSTAPVLLLAELQNMPVWLSEVREAYRLECQKRDLAPREVQLPRATTSSAAHVAGHSDLGTTWSLRPFVRSLLSERHSSWIVAYQGLASTLSGVVSEHASMEAAPRIVALPSDPMSDALDSRIVSLDFRAHEYGRAAAGLLSRTLELWDPPKKNVPIMTTHEAVLA